MCVLCSKIEKFLSVAKCLNVSKYILGPLYAVDLHVMYTSLRGSDDYQTWEADIAIDWSSCYKGNTFTTPLFSILRGTRKVIGNK